MKNKLLAGLLLLLVSYLSYGQSLTVTLDPQDPKLCSGAPVVLTATVSGGTAPYNYIWNTGETQFNITVNKAATYSVSVTDRNGRQGAAQVNVVAVSKPDAPAVVNPAIVVCYGSSARLEVANPIANATYHWYDANGNVLPGTGPVINTDPIIQNTTFFVDATLSACSSDRTAVVVVLRESPLVRPVTVCAGSPATFTATGADSYTWYDAGGNILQQGGDTFTTPTLTTSTSFYVTGTTDGCTSIKVEARAEVKAKTPTPSGGGPYEVCSGSNRTLTASGVANAVYQWFNVPSGGTPIISSQDFTTPILTKTETYYVQAVVDGCPGDRIAVTVNVTQPPPQPTVNTVAPVCYNSTAQLSVSNPVAGVTYKWYTSATSTQVYRTGSTVNSGILLTNTTFYVRAERGSCLGDAVAVPVTVTGRVVQPTVTGATIICPGPASFEATAPSGTTFKWYDTANSAPVLFEGAVFNVTVNSSRSYFVSVTTADGCESARTQIEITVTPPPSPPAAVDVRICEGNSATLRATGAANYVWYENPTGGVPVGTGAAFITPPINATTPYYVSAVDASGCESISRTRVRAIPVATPVMPNISGTNTVCEGTSTTLTASGSTGSYEWWTEKSGGTLLTRTPNLNTGNLNTSTTFWVQAVTPEGCVSDRQAQVVTVTQEVTPQFSYSSGTYCLNGPPITPSKFVQGTFSASPAGLNIRSSDGQINPAASLEGIYTVTFTPSGTACNTPTSATIEITSQAPTATFSYEQTEYCNEGRVSPVFRNGASAGSFSASGPGLVFVSTTSGEINLSRSTPGSYTITNTISNNCGTATKTFDIVINRGVNVSAGSSINVTAGTSAQLNGSVSMPGLGVTWTSSNPADQFSDINALNPIYTPAAKSGTTTLTLTTADPDPAGPCDSKSSTIVIRIISRPNPPTIANPTICFGEQATLTASAPAGTFKWYDQQTGGTLLFTGNPFVTNNLTADTAFYVTTTVNGLESERKQVSVTVNPAIAVPTVTGGGAVCSGKTTLTINETADAYEWRDSDGNLKSIDKLFEPTITQNTTYFARIRMGNCFSAPLRVDLTTNPPATVNSTASGEVCSGTAQTYTITSASNGATFTYSRAQTSGISNPAASNVSASQITEPLINTTNNEITVVYVITPSLNGCAGTPFNYSVKVLPVPTITNTQSITVCDQTPINYLVSMNPSVTSYFNWSRAAVADISNTAISGQESTTIREALQNTSNVPVDVFYTFNYGTASCPGTPFTLKVTVNPKLTITSSDFTFACSGSPVGYQIVSNVAAATFRWQRIVNGSAVSSGTSSVIDEVLTNKTGQQQFADYYVIPELNGCDGTPISLRVILAPEVPKPKVNSNSPICIEKTIILNSDVTGDKYVWTTSDGSFRDTTTVPFINIPATTAGTYNYRVEVIRGDCSGISDYFPVEVYQKPVANAGGNRTVCYDSATISLNGQVNGGVNGGPIQGRWDIVTGSGSFDLTQENLVNTYIPTQEDRDRGFIVLSLTSLDPADCESDVDRATITLGKIQAADAGPDQEVCEQGFELNGQILIAGATGQWDGGTGIFENGRTSLSGRYIPSEAERAAGSVTLTLIAIGAGPCDEASDRVTLTLLPPPTVRADASPVRYGKVGKTITLNPIVSAENVTYFWTESPAVGSLSDPTVKNPVITVGDVDVTYTLVVTSANTCVSEASSVLVKNAPDIDAPNTFTPNADGYNDQWLIEGIAAYPNAVVDIFDRRGIQIYHSIGYAKPWDGTSNGKPVPFGTYYFIIEIREGEQQKLTGYVSVIR